MTEPDKLTQAFAAEGDYESVPDEQSLEGRASWSEGFPIETQLPLSAGGIPPNRLDFNGILRALSLMLLWVQQGGQWSYETTIDYQPASLVAQNNALYYCILANGPSSVLIAPEDDTTGTYWKLVLDASGNLNVEEVDNASTTVTGIVELATQTETAALSSSSLAVTPDSLNGLVSLTPGVKKVPLADSSGKITNWVEALENSSGEIDTDISGTAAVATKLGTSTKGGTAQGIYLNGGTPMAMSASVASATKLMYMLSGVLTASSSTVGSGINPTYLNAGTVTASDSSLGGVNVPIYLNNGVFTACNTISENSAYSKGTSQGYIKFKNSGLIIQYGNATVTTSSTSYVSFSKTFTFPIEFPTACGAAIVTAGPSWGGSASGSTYPYFWCYGWSTTQTKVAGRFEHLSGGSYTVGYIAIGY